MTRPLYFIDWPLSVVADTALLPINIPRYYLSDDEARKSAWANMVTQIINILG